MKSYMFRKDSVTSHSSCRKLQKVSGTDQKSNHLLKLLPCGILKSAVIISGAFSDTCMGVSRCLIDRVAQCSVIICFSFCFL